MMFGGRLLRLLPPAASALLFTSVQPYSIASCGVVQPSDEEAQRRQQAACVVAHYEGTAGSRRTMKQRYPGCNPSTMKAWAAALPEDLGNTAERATLSRAAMEYCGCDPKQARHSKNNKCIY